MTSSISNTATDSIQLMMEQMFQKMKSADTDGIAGLSQNELSSINTDDDSGGEAFLQSLSNQFDKLDKNIDGQLSADEIFSVVPPTGSMGPPPGMNIASSNNSDSDSKTGISDSSSSVGSTNFTNLPNSLGSSFGNLASSFIEKLLGAYQNSGLSSLTSSLNLNL